MSETRSETSSKRRRYSEEFKQDAVRLVVVEKYSFEAAATAVGVCAQTLRHWHARLAPKPSECGADAMLDELREENKRLRRDLRRAKCSSPPRRRQSPGFLSRRVGQSIGGSALVTRFD